MVVEVWWWWWWFNLADHVIAHISGKAQSFQACTVASVSKTAR